MRIITLVFIALLPISNLANAGHPCEPKAISQAYRLLKFHRGPDNRIEIDNSSVKSLHPVKNPADPDQVFDVLEVWGYIYKGQYRMRFIYAGGENAKSCLLMGQEILEFARL